MVCNQLIVDSFHASVAQLSDANHSTVSNISIDFVLLADLTMLVISTDPPTLKLSRDLMNCPRNVEERRVKMR